MEKEGKAKKEKPGKTPGDKGRRKLRDDKDRGRSRERKPRSPRKAVALASVPRSPSRSPKAKCNSKGSGKGGHSQGKGSGSHCPICWHFVKGSMEQHQKTSDHCKKWQAKNAGKEPPDNRRECPRCSRRVSDSDWALYQHYCSMHPDHLSELDVPPAWLQQVKRESASSSAKRRGRHHLRSKYASRSRAIRDEGDGSKRSRSRSRHRRRHVRHSKRRSKREETPPPDHDHTALGKDQGPGPGPGSGGDGFLGGAGSVSNMLIHIGHALEMERQGKAK